MTPPVLAPCLAPGTLGLLLAVTRAVRRLVRRRRVARALAGMRQLDIEAALKRGKGRR